jgi:hypothetical protein
MQMEPEQRLKEFLGLVGKYLEYAVNTVDEHHNHAPLRACLGDNTNLLQKLSQGLAHISQLSSQPSPIARTGSEGVNIPITLRPSPQCVSHSVPRSPQSRLQVETTQAKTKLRELLAMA